MGGKMNTATVIRDKNGKVINIGEWDYMKEDVEDHETGEVIQLVNNPFPEGATFTTEEIVTLEDGGKAAANQ
jgi:hypothetical protein